MQEPRREQRAATDAFLLASLTRVFSGPRMTAEEERALSLSTEVPRGATERGRAQHSDRVARTRARRVAMLAQNLENEALKEEIRKLQAQLQELQRKQNVEGRSNDYFSRYFERECKTDEEKSALKNDVESFWERLKDYQTEENRYRAYGLVVGRVQSGKTRNYIGLMFKAIDEGYNTIIVVTSKNNLLAKQTHDRVMKWFGNAGLQVPNYHALTRAGEQDGISWQGGDFSSNRINVGIVMKNLTGHLDKLSEWLSGIGEECRSQMKLLFIDDESDNATPNTNTKEEPDITCDKDVETQLLTPLLQKAKPNFDERSLSEVWDPAMAKVMSDASSSARKRFETVAEWVKEIKEAEFSDADFNVVKAFLDRTTTYDALFKGICNNPEIKRILKLDGDFYVPERIPRETLILAEDMFRARARGRSRPFPNQSIFRDFLRFVFDVRQERSKINESIVNVVGKDSRYAEMLYVGYTATPFANLLNEDPTKDPLCPDCIIPLTTSSKYIGLERMFGSGVGGKPYNMDVFRDVSENEEDAWVLPIHQSRLPINDIQPSLIRTHECEDGRKVDVEWASLKKAIQWAYCTAAARRVMRRVGKHSDDYADTDYRWTTMLFNISHRADQEEGAHAVQEKIVKAYLEQAIVGEHKETFIQECMALWREEIGKFGSDDFVSACPGYGDPASYPSENDVEEALRDWFLGYKFGEKVKVIQMNAAVNYNHNHQMDYNNPGAGAGGDVLWIICGGNAISRGLTLKGLTVSYYDRIRESSAVDSITQMGRWFGYRIGYELLPRIWMTKETVAEMKNISRIESLLHESLARAFYVEGEEDADKTSFRKGRSVGDIRYFGRRLSGRDANAVEIPGAGVECVFATVDNDPTKALDITHEWIEQGLGLDNRAKLSENAGDLQKRHPYYWQDISSENIIAYIRKMKDECFRGVSKDKAEGVLIDIANRGVSSWNVVIGNPNTQIPLNAIAGVTDMHRASRVLNPQPDGSVRIGNSSVVESNAYMTGIPTEIIQQAKNELGTSARGNDIIVGKAFALASAKGRMEETRPVLQIGFVQPSNRTEQTFVQVSFYWHGHDNGSFLRAIVNPDPVVSMLIQKTIKIVEQRKYIPKFRLLEILRKQEPSFDEKAFELELREVSSQIGSTIGILGKEEAEKCVLESNVVYDKKWVDHNKKDKSLCDGDVIGLDLYDKIRRNGWDRWNDQDRVDFDALTKNGYDYIMGYDYPNKQYKWFAFKDRYAGRQEGANDVSDASRNPFTPRTLEQCGAEFGHTIIDGVDYIHVYHLLECQEYWPDLCYSYIRPVVKRGMQSDGKGRFRVVFLAYNELEHFVEVIDDGRTGFMYDPQMGIFGPDRVLDGFIQEAEINQKKKLLTKCPHRGIAKLYAKLLGIA